MYSIKLPFKIDFSTLTTKNKHDIRITKDKTVTVAPIALSLHPEPANMCPVKIIYVRCKSPLYKKKGILVLVPDFSTTDCFVLLVLS